MHRVGRTARAGKTGRAITLVTQYDVEIFQKIETLIGKKLEEHPVEDKHALILNDSVVEAGRQAAIEMKEAKYMREEEAAGDDAKDDAEANNDGNMFKKTTYKNTKFAH